MRELSLKQSRLDKRYDILELLGRGSYAEIFVARDSFAPGDSPHLQVVVKALNVFMQNDLDADLERTLVENFQNEAVALDRVRHPNIISRLGHGTARDLKGTVFHYLILEYLSGGDLAQASRQGRIGVDQALYYIEQVCAGLGHAHSKGVIHRDVKPQNLLLSEDKKTVKIADFGVARFQMSDSPVTRVGTNIYAPPEHSPVSLTDGSPDAFAELTAAADVYSLAKTAYALITGESPRAFINKPVTSLPERFLAEPWASGVLEVLNHATRSAPNTRHQSVDAFWFDLSIARGAASGEEETAVSKRSAPRPKAHVARGYIPNAPERPDFNRGSLPGSTHMRPAMPQTPRSIPSTPAPAPQSSATPNASRNEKPKKKRNLLIPIAAIFIVVSMGALGYLAYAGLDWATGLTSAWSGKKTGTVTTDVNLRQQASSGSPKIGLIPRNSRVRIVNSKDNWYEVDVIDYGRPKDSTGDSSRGWISARYVEVD